MLNTGVIYRTLLSLIRHRLCFTACLLFLSACGGGGTTPQQPSNNNGVEQGEGNVTNAADKYTATLSWNLPKTRENGRLLPINEIGGFEIKFRSIEDADYTSITIEGADISSYTLGKLSAGTYEIVVATFDINGFYSEFSKPQRYTLGS